MAHKIIIAAVGTLIAASAAAQPETPPSTAPAGDAHTRYCLRVEAITGSRIETIQCRTREDWAALEVDVDQEWAENGVRVINA